ncbi:MAG: hypothetical protein U0T83_02475 [Bacteriovoracaceae bacterium]
MLERLKESLFKNRVAIILCINVLIVIHYIYINLLPSVKKELEPKGATIHAKIIEVI